MNILLKSYEGPLDLLYTLIMKQKIDIYDISIFEITKQYLNHLDSMKKMDLNITSDFIVMACKLIEIKSKYLLFKKDEEEEDPTQELIDRLVIYKKFKNASSFLKSKLENSKDVFFRKREEYFIAQELDLSNSNINCLIEFIHIILKYTPKETCNPFEKIYREKYVSIEEKIEYVKKRVSTEGVISFKNLVQHNKKDDIVATFLSILELIKNKDISIYQETFLSDIIVKRVDD